MMELGQESLAEHQVLIDLINNYSWKNVILVGGDFKNVSHRFIYLNSSLEAAQWLQDQKFKNTNILVKGSRSTRMEKVLE